MEKIENSEGGYFNPNLNLDDERVDQDEDENETSQANLHPKLRRSQSDKNNNIFTPSVASSSSRSSSTASSDYKSLENYAIKMSQCIVDDGMPSVDAVKDDNVSVSDVHKSESIGLTVDPSGSIESNGIKISVTCATPLGSADGNELKNPFDFKSGDQTSERMELTFKEEEEDVVINEKDEITSFSSSSSSSSSPKTPLGLNSNPAVIDAQITEKITRSEEKKINHSNSDSNISASNLSNIKSNLSSKFNQQYINLKQIRPNLSFSSVNQSNPITIAVRQINYSYELPGFGLISSTPVLKNISLTVPQGAIYALLGASGCGKTTLLRCILGRLQPKSGTVRVFGREPGKKYSSVPGPGVGYMPQELALFPDFTIQETFTYFARLHQMTKKEITERVDFLIKLLHLPDKTRRVDQCSGGQQRRISLGAALVHKPPLLILDEPTVGADPLLRSEIWKHLMSLCATGMTVVITTHYIEEARQAGTVGLMRNGRLLVEENPEVLLRTYALPTLEDVFLKLCLIEDHDKDRFAVAIGGSAGTNGKIAEGYEDSSDQEEEDSHRVKNLKVNNEPHGINLSPTNEGTLKIPTNIYCEVSRSVTPDLIQTSEDIIHAQTADKEPRFIDKSNIKALFTKNMIRLTRSKVLFFAFLLLPSIEFITFAICIGPPPDNLNVAIFNPEVPPEYSKDFLSYIDKKTIIQQVYPSRESARQAVIDGKAWAAIFFSPNFSQALDDRRIYGNTAENETIIGSEVKMIMDFSNWIIGVRVIRSMIESFWAFTTDYLRTVGANPNAISLPLRFEEIIYGSLKPAVVEFMTPGIICLTAFYATTALSGFALVLERKDGLLERSLIAGVNASEFLISHIMAHLIILTVQMTLMLLTCFWLFDFINNGSIVLVTVLTFLQGIAGIMFGLFISSLCDTEVSAAIMGFLPFFPTIILGGIFWPLEAMPPWMYFIARLIPQSYPTEALRSILSRGWGLEFLIVNLGFIVSIFWVIIFLFGSVYFFKKFTVQMQSISLLFDKFIHAFW